MTTLADNAKYEREKRRTMLALMYAARQLALVVSFAFWYGAATVAVWLVTGHWHWATG